MTFFGITAKNEAQKVAMRALINDKPFTFLTGPAGTGKTLVAQAVGLDSVLGRQIHRKLFYTRIQEQVGKDVGALPGDLITGKTYPFIAPFMDNLEVITSSPGEFKRYFSEDNEDKRKIFFDPIQTIRGRSIDYSFALYDEIQNVDEFTMTAIATRLGVNSKFVFLGNFAQIDNPKLRNPERNGLYRLLQGLYERGAHQYFDHINLTETYRHPVIDVVEDIFRNDNMDPRFAELEARGNVGDFS